MNRKQILILVLLICAGPVLAPYLLEIIALSELIGIAGVVSLSVAGIRTAGSITIQRIWAGLWRCSNHQPIPIIFSDLRSIPERLAYLIPLKGLLLATIIIISAGLYGLNLYHLLA